MEIVDKYNKPLQIVTKDNTSNILEVASVSLHGKPPPNEFRIPFPANPEIAAPGNALKLEVTYSYNGADKDPYSAPLMNYTAVIDSIYVANLDDPDRQAKQLDFHFSESTYRGDLIIQSESPNKKAFQINQIRCHIQYKDGRKLSDATVSPAEVSLGKPFRVEVPEADPLDWYGNKLVLNIDYYYEGTAKSATVEIPFKLQGGTGGFPIWLLWLLLIPLLVAAGFFLIRRLILSIMPRPVEYHIALTEVSGAGTPLRETQYFTLENEATLEFGPRGPDELRFDVVSTAFLYANKKEILLFTDDDNDEGQILELPEMLTLSRGEEGEVRIRVEFVDEHPDESPADEEWPVADSANRSDPA